MNLRIRISSDGSLDACFIEKFSAAALDFNGHRNRKPAIITDSSLINFDSFSLSRLIDAVDDLDIDVLVAKDGKNFLKHELCTTKSVHSRYALETILYGVRDEGRPLDKSRLEETAGEPESTCRMYARMYLDQHPRVREMFDLSYLSAIASIAAASDENQQKQRAASPSSSVTGLGPSHTPDSPAVDSIATSNNDDDDDEVKKTHHFKDKNIGLWVSSQGCATPLHFDLCHGFLVQIFGRKTFILAPADDSTLVHYWLQTQRQKRETDSQSKNATTSPVDLGKWIQGDKIERQKYSRIDEVGWYIAELAPGDVLYTPPGWWHYVVSDTVSVSLLVPFDPNPDIESLPANVLMVG
jgi:Cupin-like domain